MSVSPEVKQKKMDALAKRDAERLKTALLGALDTGWLLFQKGSPRARLSGYVQNTLDIDVPLVTMDGYLDKLARDEVPMLYCVQRVQQRQIESGIIDPMTGLPVEPPTPEPPMLWSLILTLPPYVFEALSRDFRLLLRSQDRKEPYRSDPWGVA